MKKIKHIRVLFILLTILISCNKDSAKLKIEDFTKSKTIVLEPYKHYPYTMMNIWVKGYTNDTILIKLNSKTSKPILKLSGEIDKRWHTDYYGEGPRTFILEPYKATKGKLEIEISL